MANRLYRFYNFLTSKHGEPFAICDKHKGKQMVPGSCNLIKIADRAVEECDACRIERRIDEDPTASSIGGKDE